MKSTTSAAARQVQHLLLATIVMLVPVYAFSMIENFGFASFLVSPIVGAMTVIYSITILAVWHKQKRLPEPPKPLCIAHRAAIIFAFIIAFFWLTAVCSTIGITVSFLQSPDWGTTFAGQRILPAFEAASDLVQAILFLVLGLKMVKSRKEMMSNPEVVHDIPLEDAKQSA